MNDKEKILWLAARLREYASYLKLNDLTFHDDIPEEECDPKLKEKLRKAKRVAQNS